MFNIQKTVTSLVRGALHPVYSRPKDSQEPAGDDISLSRFLERPYNIDDGETDRRPSART